jgi:hypothetical protein
MTQQEAQKHLECANERLEQAIALVVQKPYTISRCHKQLQETARRLDYVRRNAPKGSLSSSLAQPLRAIRVQLGRLEHLLDTAATFYCANMSNQISHGDTYTPEGALAPALTASGLKLEA